MAAPPQRAPPLLPRHCWCCCHFGVSPAASAAAADRNAATATVSKGKDGRQSPSPDVPLLCKYTSPRSGTAMTAGPARWCGPPAHLSYPRTGGSRT